MRQLQKTGHIVMRQDNRQPAGSTLLELLMAMTILIIIIAMIGNLFEAGEKAWQRGMQNTRSNIEGRSAVDFMAAELADAVADSMFPCEIVSNGVTFFTLRGVADATNRAIVKVQYAVSGTALTRQSWHLSTADTYPTLLTSSPPATLATNIAFLAFSTPDDPGTYINNLPPWMDIRLGIWEAADNSQVRVFSVGPTGTNGIPGDDDDIADNSL
jgi:hypothetical protein